MNRSDIKEYFRTLTESTTKEQNKRSVLRESNDQPEDPAYASQFGSHLDDEEDVGELARYHVLNNDVDATLYRDNPDYRDAFKVALINNEAGYSEEYEKMTDSFSPYDK